MELSLLNGRIIVKIYSRENNNTTHIYKLSGNELYSDVLENHNFVIDDFGGKYLNILNQIHKDDIFELNESPLSIKDAILKLPTADGIVTNLKEQILAIQTADCVPILLYSSSGNTICALHCGWRSAFAKIIDKASILIKEREYRILGNKNFQIHAIIGPSIQVDSYEVDKKFCENFLANDGNNKNFFKVKNDLKIFFNLPKYLINDLSKNDILLEHHFKEDTYSNPQKYPSYRYSSHLNEKYKGSILSAIMIKS